MQTCFMTAKTQVIATLSAIQELVGPNKKYSIFSGWPIEPRKSHSKEKVKIKMTVHKIRNGKVYGPKTTISKFKQ